MYAERCPRGLLRGPGTGCECERPVYDWRIPLMCVGPFSESLRGCDQGCGTGTGTGTLLGRPARLEYADCFGARTGCVGGRWGRLRGREARGRREGAACSCHDDGRHRRTEVVACGSSGLATDEGAGSGRCPGVGGWAEGRRAKGLGLACSGGWIGARMLLLLLLLLMVRCDGELAGHRG